MPKRAMTSVFRMILPRGAENVMVPFCSDTDTHTSSDMTSANACNLENEGCLSGFIVAIVLIVQKYKIFSTFVVSKLILMKKFLIWLLFAAILMAPSLCGAQVSVRFKTLAINNISNKRTAPRRAVPFDAIILSDVSLVVGVELVNNGDSAVNLYAEAATIGLLYYDSQYGWRKIERLDDRDCLTPLQLGLCYVQHPYIEAHSSVTIQRFWYYRFHTFYDVSSLYYVSSTVPTMRLFLSIPGQEPIISDAPETIYVNGVKLDSNEQECGNGDSYQLVNNELVQEYMRENPYLFGSEFSQDILIREFQRNMALAKLQYSQLRLPEMSQCFMYR